MVDTDDWHHYPLGDYAETAAAVSPGTERYISILVATDEMQDYDDCARA
jgi:hypothetical protein